MTGERIGSTIGSIAGLVFMMVNAGPLGEPAATIIRVVAVPLFLAALWFATVRPPAPASPPQRPGKKAIRVYGFAVLFMVLAIWLGAQFITAVLGLPEVVVVWVVFIVGAHFLPFAKTFSAPVFAVLSWALIGLAVVGAVVAITVSTAFAAWTAVLAGVVMLGFSACGAYVNRRASGRFNPMA